MRDGVYTRFTQNCRCCNAQLPCPIPAEDARCAACVKADDERRNAVLDERAELEAAERDAGAST